MGFFNKLFGSLQPSVQNAENEGILLATNAGTLLKTSEISDAVFAQEMMGPTIALKPAAGTVCAPVSGTISALYPTGHAFGITTAQGAEVLVHIGIDTVNLNGKGFKILGKADQKVKAGDPVIEMDLNTIHEVGLDDSVMTILTNPDLFEWGIDQQPGASLSSKAPLGTLKKK